MPKYHISGYLLNLNLAFYTVAFKCGIKSASDLNEKKQKKQKLSQTWSMIMSSLVWEYQ